ncbi:aminotransferase class III-fold pyridoxal phosphate-dependent enzyme [Streptomyces yunnanensis]|uniref:Aminotransferase class III-fold pyridoxal phosphate-dependent enzyme n=1 Tax=Streptomyces yunnanensis TaxID=156453 RepID=A0ABY8ANR1_9ACTN|nr:aminotransferase class III-fold pyridoxal phosphate-dependent enzyme [Streptomyces yunnanensis]WEB45510.1 aminotransferase class III-fold pyridoxal phosphate-dependent enzyme [Streptomyces yunnanensis]
MESAVTEPKAAGPVDLTEPHLRETLAMAGLDVEYVRAEHNTLYYLDENGEEVPVVDFTGGYGSLLLGHNNSQIVARAREALDGQVPVHAQFAPSSHANAVAFRLNEILRRELGSDEPYFAIFANSGAEAIEAAVKHAELDRVMRAGVLAAQLAAHAEQARAAVSAGTAEVTAGALAQLGLKEGGVAELLAEAERRNAEQMARPPVFLALEGGFHGKLMGSVQLTHNPGFRTPFSALATQARFIPLGRRGAVGEALAAERAVVFDIVVDGSEVRVAERDLPVVCALLVEPIQGEGGIVEVSRELAEEIGRECQAAGCPVIVDEIQSGMGRTGSFLASSSLGLRGDYYTLAKSLGGGIAKNSVMLVRQSRYRREFEMVHSSTFAKDAFSSLIAQKVLDILEADGGQVYRLATERGNKLKSVLLALREEFPGVVKDVRGRGLMLGLEFTDQTSAPSETFRGFAQAGILGYALAGYLLKRHRVRTFPTASAVSTLRFEPSVYVSDAEIDQLAAALRALCEILRDQDEARFFGS